jgi:hypothetical protein
LATPCALLLSVVLPLLIAAADKKSKRGRVLKGLPVTELTDEEASRHAFGRLGYGPRPGDIDRVRQMGLAKWIDGQLHPDSADDRFLEARLGTYPTLVMSTTHLLAEPEPAAKQAMPSRPEAATQTDQAPAGSSASSASRDSPSAAIAASPGTAKSARHIGCKDLGTDFPGFNSRPSKFPGLIRA